MKRIFGAIAFTLAVPGFAQVAPSTDNHAHNAQLQAGHGHQQCKHDMEEMQQHCLDVMKEQARADKLAKKAAAKLDAEFNGNGHQGHNH